MSVSVAAAYTPCTSYTHHTHSTGKFFLLVVRNTDLLIVLLVRMAVSPATFGQNTDVGNGQVCTNTDVGKIRTGNQNTGEAGKHVPKLQHKIFKVPELH